MTSFVDILSRQCTWYRESYRSNGGCYDATEHEDDATTWSIDVAIDSVAGAVTACDATDGGYEGGCGGYPPTTYGSPPPAGGEQGGCPCVWSWATTYSQGVELWGLSETPADEVWRQDQSWCRRPMTKEHGENLWCEDVPGRESTIFCCIHAHRGGGALVDMHEVHHGGVGWAGHVGVF